MRELHAIGAQFVIVDQNAEVARSLSAELDCVAVVGDATHDEVLANAGIERARGVISALTEDKDNLFVTVTARALNPALRIVAKAIDVKADAKLRRAGADAVVSPAMIGGLRLVSEMVRPEVVSFLDVMLRDKEHALRIEEVAIGDESPLANQCVKDLNLSRHKLLLLAVKETAGRGSRLHYNPAPDRVVARLGEPDVPVGAAGDGARAELRRHRKLTDRDDGSGGFRRGEEQDEQGRGEGNDTTPDGSPHADHLPRGSVVAGLSAGIA